MKTLLFILLLFSFTAHADEWTEDNTKAEIAYQVIAAVDWAQTRTIARNKAKYSETNPLLGDHPTLGQVNRHFITFGLLHYSISKMLPSQYRTPFQYGSIIVEFWYVQHNYKLGINASF